MSQAATQSASDVQSGRLRADVTRLLRLGVPVIVKLAERRMRMKDLLQVSPGAIIEFSKPAEEPLDLLVNNVRIGCGEVVKVGENFGLRITLIGAAAEMIRAMGPGQEPVAATPGDSAEPGTEQDIFGPPQNAPVEPAPGAPGPAGPSTPTA
ncbi:MAG: hypothetical protein BIFFINMI_04039 [Phycisphaerae bacterium]|nr:hypothetical protein [Phycisphaerae bacterium]